MGVRPPLGALAAGLLAFGSGCLSADVKKSEAKKPDVTRPGVLPPPQETTRTGPVSGPSGVVQASATMPGAPAPAAPAVSSGPSFSKLAGALDRKTLATEMAVTWQPRVAYLPDPSRNGRMSPGLAGGMFLFGGPKSEFVLADGTLTVDLVDETPRPAGQPGVTAERWQFDKDTLRKLQANHETFGKSYVLFLPWPAYRPDVTKVRISARYDPETGHTLFATPSSVSIDAKTPFGAPVWEDRGSTSGTVPPARTQQPGFGSAPVTEAAFSPIPIGGPPASNVLPLGGPPPVAPVPPAGVMPLMPQQPGAAAPLPPPDDLPQFGITLPTRR